LVFIKTTTTKEDDMSYLEKKKEWLASNPLRQWRLKEKLSLNDVGAAAGTGYHTIYRWEQGMSNPSDNF